MQLVLPPPPAAGESPTSTDPSDGDVDAARAHPGRHACRPAPPGAAGGGRGDARPLLDPDDRSLQVHACHGRARQVEVMRDAVLHLLTRTPTLEPRDVIVMCPDIETFAPLIHATFGAGRQLGEDDDGTAPADGGRAEPDLRVRLADRSLRQTNPVLGVVARAARARRLAGDRQPRCSTSPAASPSAAVSGSTTTTSPGSRSGSAAPASAGGSTPSTVRRSSSASSTPTPGRRASTAPCSAWRWPTSGLRLFGGVLPLDDVDSGDIDLAGRFAELIDRLETRSTASFGGQADRRLGAAIAAAADALLPRLRPRRLAAGQLQRMLDDLLGEARSTRRPTRGRRRRRPDPARCLADIRALLADRLRGRPTRANFRTGHLTICTLVPMRSVPHRVVCLLGLDDGVVPRATSRATATTSSWPTRASATATPAARTASSCSMP